MADKKITALPERVTAIVGTDLLPIVGNVASSPTNYRVQVKNFLANLQIDLPQTSVSTLKLTANVAANSANASFAAAEFALVANSSANFTVKDRIGLIVRNEILNGNSNVTGTMAAAQFKLDTGNSNCQQANTFGLIVEHLVANTSWARVVAPRAFVAFKDTPGTNGNATPYLFDIGAEGQTVSANTSTGNGSVLFSYTSDRAATRALRIVVNGEVVWLLATNVAPGV